MQLIPDFAFAGARHALGFVLAGLGGALSVLAVRRWRRVQAAMRRDEDLPPTRVPVVLSAVLIAMTGFVLVLLVLSPARP